MKTPGRAKTIKYSIKEVFTEGIDFIDTFHNNNQEVYWIDSKKMKSDQKIAQRIMPLLEEKSDKPAYVFGLSSPTTSRIDKVPRF